MALLEIKNLKGGPEGAEILKEFSLTIKEGETHAIMGPNGTGKSTLSYLLAGRDGYEATSGSVKFQGQDLLDLSPEERALAGLFLAFQYPVEIPGVSNNLFLRQALNARRKQKGEAEIEPIEFVRLLRAHARELGISDDMLKRAVNEGFSGGEKKRNEALQMALLDPEFAILDETDSGLDIDALKLVASAVNARRAKPTANGVKPGFLIITHYKRLLDYIRPDYIHVMTGGRIVKSGGPELADTLEADGYAAFGEK